MPVLLHKEHLLDRAVMVAIRATLAVTPTTEFGPKARPDFDFLMEKTPGAEGVTYEAATVGGVPGWWCKPRRPRAGCAIAYFHGGAYVIGSAVAYKHFGGQIAERAQAPVFLAEYALAPEQPFPGAVRGAEAVYRGLLQQGFVKLAVAGDSAGGGLALALSLLMIAAANAEMLLTPVAVLGFSPWTDLALTGDSLEERKKDDPLLTREALDHAAALYLGAHDRRDPRASPLYGDLSGLPPVLLHVGGDEILLDDSVRFVTLAEAGGAMAEVNVWQGMTHVFASNLTLQAAKKALQSAGFFLGRQFEMHP
jgi:monoterpene epsilon-lactone hydrolase